MNPSVTAIEAVAPNLSGANAVSSAGGAPTAQFGNWIAHEISQVNTQMVDAERAAQQLAVGGTASVHDTMIQLEQARLSFQLAIQVRARVLEAYQEVMRMQV
ncbi:flagellar hook-basal body complex protein FliE [Paucibacter sp. KBW04]|uniref:flagellar hook-basal body complex protein FliE n=1 Tax=Paucibacter sp. KBW04 TaxID=2153361 RepID=UPI000F57FCD4|nr:flagellar hook-basal body complex protein FliE [Paucibacter sp. KBW04]RQO63592.1 flagellar hook-basal body complex protein FliE [Paucibacter sp. KBW04]